jgi:hypothetical protein
MFASTFSKRRIDLKEHCSGLSQPIDTGEHLRYSRVGLLRYRACRHAHEHLQHAIGERSACFKYVPG